MVQRLRHRLEPHVVATSGGVHKHGGEPTTPRCLAATPRSQINYIDAVSGGYVVGSFNGSVMDAIGSATTLSQGSFQLNIN